MAAFAEKGDPRKRGFQTGCVPRVDPFGLGEEGNHRNSMSPIRGTCSGSCLATWWLASRSKGCLSYQRQLAEASVISSAEFSEPDDGYNFETQYKPTKGRKGESRASTCRMLEGGGRPSQVRRFCQMDGFSRPGDEDAEVRIQQKNSQQAQDR